MDEESKFSYFEEKEPEKLHKLSMNTSIDETTSINSKVPLSWNIDNHGLGLQQKNLQEFVTIKHINSRLKKGSIKTMSKQDKMQRKSINADDYNSQYYIAPWSILSPFIHSSQIV